MGCSDASGDGLLAGGQEASSDSRTRESEQAWKEFEKSSTRVADDGTTYYVVEWDIPILTESELREYYEENVSTHRESGVAEVRQRGVLHLVPNTTIDDVWANDDELHLRYCIDTNPTTGFGPPFALAMMSAMQQATAAWHAVANVDFQYDSANNDNCGKSSPIPDNRYIKVSRDDTLGSPCSFGPLSHSSWTCPGLDGNTIGVNTGYLSPPPFPGFNWPGVLMHEVGHALGLHHEQNHTNGGGCTTADARNVTATADLTSIMGYPKGNPSCALTTPNTSALSANDGWTVRQLYGMPAAWYVPIMM